MKRLGAEELLFTSDAQAVLPRSLKLRPADDVMLTINFMRDKGGIQNLSRVQVGGCGHMTTTLVT